MRSRVKSWSLAFPSRFSAEPGCAEGNTGTCLRVLSSSVGAVCSAAPLPVLWQLTAIDFDMTAGLRD